MKRNAFVLSLLLVMAGLHMQAQGFHLGIKAGADLYKVDGESFDQQFKFGYNVGAFSEINFTKSWGIQPEVTFNQTNYRTANNVGGIVPEGFSDVKGKLNYLTIPLLLSYRPIRLLSLQAGPQFGILLNPDEHLVNNGEQAFKKGDFSLVGGAQLNLLKFILGARYVIGLANINDVTSNDTWKNQGWQLYAGFRIF